MATIEERRIDEIKKVLLRYFGKFFSFMTDDIKCKVFREIARECIKAYDQADKIKNNGD